MARRRPGGGYISFLNTLQRKSILPGQPEEEPRRAEGVAVVQVGSIGGDGGGGHGSHDSHSHHNADLPDLHDIRQIWNPGAERMLDLSAEALAHF